MKTSDKFAITKEHVKGALDTCSLMNTQCHLALLEAEPKEGDDVATLRLKFARATQAQFFLHNLDITAKVLVLLADKAGIIDIDKLDEEDD